MRGFAITGALALLLGGCTFGPKVDPAQLRCELGVADGCPDGYVCAAAAGTAAGFGLCCPTGGGPCGPGPDAGNASSHDGPTIDADDDGPTTDADDDGPTTDAAEDDASPTDADSDAPDAPDVDAPDAPDAPDVDAPAPDAPDAPAIDAPAPDAPAPDAPAPDAADAADTRPDAPATCADPCPLATMKCGPTLGVQTCVLVDGCAVWSAEQPCGGHKECRDGATGCQCKAGDCGGPRQVPGDECRAGVVAHCQVDGDGCGYATGADPCPGRLLCAGPYPDAKCTCPAPPAACHGQVGTFCDGGRLTTCGKDFYGCLDTTSRVDCPAAGCTGELPAATCSWCSSPPSTVCPGIGRVCNGNELVTCTLDASGCVSPSVRRTCMFGRSCVGEFAFADCECGGNTSCKPEIVGLSTDLGGALEHPTSLLMAMPIDILDGAFVPMQMTVIVRSSTGPTTTNPQMRVALYASDAKGEPGKLVVDTLPSDTTNLGPISVDLGSWQGPKLPSGRYWMAVAFNRPTVVGHDTGGVSVPVRSVMQMVDWMKPGKLPDPFDQNEVPQASTATRPNYYMTIIPR